MRRVGHFAAAVALVLMSVIVAFLAVEFSYRAYLAAKFSHAAFPASFVSSFFSIDDVRQRVPGEGLYFPNLDIPYRHFSGTHELLFQSRIRTNNMGYRADRDWSLEKPPRELRIAVLGDSLTASLMSDYAWTDVAERVLNDDPALLADLDVNRVAVLNFGVVGAGFDTMAQVEEDHARRFGPDLTIVAFISPDILRPALNIQPIAPPEAAVRVYQGLVDLSTDGIKAATVVECDTPAVGLGIAGCRPSTVIRMDDEAVANSETARIVKLALSRGFLWDSLWRSTYPYALASVMGKPFQLHAGGLAEFLGTGGEEGTPVESEEQSLRRSTATLQRLRDRASPLMILHLPTVTEIQQRAVHSGLAQLLDQAGGFDIQFLGESPRLKGEPDDEVASWFNLPHDSHLSTKGVEVYGGAFADQMASTLRKLRHAR
jgi:hypothetical protein